MTSHPKSEGPAAGDAARGAHGRLARAGSGAGGQPNKNSDVEHQPKLLATFGPCREAREQAARRAEEKLRTARAVAGELGFEEIEGGRFEALCPECGAFVSFGCDGVVEDNPRGSCKALPSIRARVKSSFDGGGR